MDALRKAQIENIAAASRATDSWRTDSYVVDTCQEVSRFCTARRDPRRKSQVVKPVAPWNTPRIDPLRIAL